MKTQENTEVAVKTTADAPMAVKHGTVCWCRIGKHYIKRCITSVLKNTLLITHPT